MEQDNKDEKVDPITHATGRRESEDSSTYDPDRYLIEEEDFEEGKPLTGQTPNEGYSTDARQGKQSATLHLADEDMDRRTEDAATKAEDLQESYAKSKKNSDVEKAKEELKNGQDE